jgi:hypothetical protein
MQTRTRVENLKPEPGFGFKIEHSAGGVMHAHDLIGAYQL